MSYCRAKLRPLPQVGCRITVVGLQVKYCWSVMYRLGAALGVVSWYRGLCTYVKYIVWGGIHGGDGHAQCHVQRWVYLQLSTASYIVMQPKPILPLASSYASTPPPLQPSSPMQSSLRLLANAPGAFCCGLHFQWNAGEIWDSYPWHLLGSSKPRVPLHILRPFNAQLRRNHGVLYNYN